MKLGKSIFEQVGKEVLDLSIIPGTLGLKYFNYLKSTSICVFTDSINHISSFSGTCSNSQGNFEVELDQKQRKVSFSPSSKDSPVFTFQNLKEKPNKGFTFSGSFPFSFKQLDFVMNGSKTKYGNFSIHSLRIPYELLNVKIDSRFFICPDANFDHSSLINISHPLFEISVQNQRKASEFHFQLNDWHPQKYFSVFSDFSFDNLIISSFQFGGRFDISKACKLSYLYNSLDLIHKTRMTLESNNLKFGIQCGAKQKELNDFKVGLFYDVSQFSLAFTLNKDLKCIFQTNIPMPDIGNFSITAGVDVFDFRNPSLSASLLIVE